MNCSQATELFRRRVAEGNLLGFCCTSCGQLCVPPSSFCPSCLGDSVTPQPLTGRGRIEGFSTAHAVRSREPIRVAYVQLEEGPRIACQIKSGTGAVGSSVHLVASPDPACLTFSLETSLAEQS